VRTAAEYRQLAEECFGWAATASTDEVRVTYLSIAQIWLQAAFRLDCGLPIGEALILAPNQGDEKFDELESS
jgi:hypothetical protein